MEKIPSRNRQGKRITNRSAAAIVAGLMLGFVLLDASSPGRADDSVGSVTEVTGSAQIQRAGATLAAQQGTSVKLHDRVTTAPDASMTLGFADGSSIALNGGTSVAIEDVKVVNGQPLPSRVTLMSGRIHTNVPDKTGQQHSIEVDTQSGTATGPSPNQ
jgi:ferric-dicitrate binding protein FerR (iron transport regulator)